MASVDAADGAGAVLIVVAHPDDEVIFFWQRLRSLAGDGRRLHIACATDDFGSFDYTAVRRREFRRSCRMLRATPHLLGFRDAAALDGDALHDRLKDLAAERSYASVYTHGIWGEYGHEHHAAVSWAVHRAFDPVRSLAGPFRALEAHVLGAAALDDKRRFARDVYRSQPAAALWCTGVEQFTVLRRDEAALFRFLASGQVSDAAGLVSEQPQPVRSRLIRCVHACAARFSAAVPPCVEVASMDRGTWASALRTWRNAIEEFSNAVSAVSVGVR